MASGIVEVCQESGGGTPPIRLREALHEDYGKPGKDHGRGQDCSLRIDR